MSLVGFCLGGYVAGLLLATYFTPSPIPLILFSCLTLLFFILKRNLRTSFYALLLFCLLVGLLRDAAIFSAYATSLDSFVGPIPVRIMGKVLSTNERPMGGMSVDIAVQRLGPGLVERGSGQRLRLYINKAELVPGIGRHVVFYSRIRRTRNFGIPGEFDYVRHLAYRQIWHTAYLPDSRGLAVFVEPSAGFSARVALIRQEGLRMLERTLSPERAILLKGLLLGEKGAMSRELRQRLANGGVAHLFAISGLHLGMLAFLLYFFLKFLYCRSIRLLLWQPPVRVLWLIILPLLFLYLQFTGDALSTRRAFYALLIPACLYLFRRRVTPLNLLLGLAFLFLMFEPLALWQPSFLLSFSGVLGILLWQKPLRLLLKPCPGFVRYPLLLFGVSLAAFISTLPVVAMVFHLVAPAGLLSNLIAIPVVSFIALPSGLFGLLLSCLGFSGGPAILEFSATVLQWIVNLADWVNELPGFSAHRIYLTLPENLAIFFFCLALLIGWRYRKGLFFLLPALCLLGFSPAANSSAELTLFSVGQGEAMLLKVNGDNILIDGGGLRSEDFDVGERLLAPALGRLGVKKLDAVLLTHNHPDHSGGLAYIIDHFAVRQFWSGSDSKALDPDLRQILLKKGVEQYNVFEKGWQRKKLGDATMVLLYVAPDEARGENNRSLCLYLPTTSGGILLTGDLEAQGVSALLQSSHLGRVGLLKVPHHGSAGSNPGKLVARLRPKVIVVSAGYDNPYHFPSSQLLDQAAAQEVRVWRTDLDGTIQVRAEGQQWRVRHWSKRLFR